MGKALGNEEDPHVLCREGDGRPPSKGRTATTQVYYNVMTRDAETELFPLCIEQNIGTLIRAPMKSGILTGKFTPDTVFEPTDHRANWLTGDLLSRAVDEANALVRAVAPMFAAEAALRFILNQDAVSTIRPGAKNPAQVESNCAASDGKGLEPRMEKAVRDAVPGTFERRT